MRFKEFLGEKAHKVQVKNKIGLFKSFKSLDDADAKAWAASSVDPEEEADRKIWPRGFNNEKFEKDCAFYLEQLSPQDAKRARLWRGDDREHINVNQPNKWTPRNGPLETPRKVHNELNEFFTQQFGKPFRNGMFTTGDYTAAEFYGRPRVIVPIGKFEWLNSRQFFDLYNEIIDAVDKGKDSTNAEADLIRKVKSSKKWIHNEDLMGCIRSKKEIMLWCPDGYYAFDEEHFLPKAMR